MSIINDPVTAPAHYIRPGGVEPLEFLMSNGVTYPEADIIQYVFRWRDKGGLQDLEKAAFYLKRLIEHERKKAAAAARDKNPPAAAAQIDLVDYANHYSPPPPRRPSVNDLLATTESIEIAIGRGRKTSLQE